MPRRDFKDELSVSSGNCWVRGQRKELPSWIRITWRCGQSSPQEAHMLVADFLIEQISVGLWFFKGWWASAFTAVMKKIKGIIHWFRKHLSGSNLLSKINLFLRQILVLDCYFVCEQPCLLFRRYITRMRYANGVMANTRLKQRILFKHKNTMYLFTCKKWKGDRGERFCSSYIIAKECCISL